MKFILGTKLNMTQKFSENGDVTAVTAVQAGPCTVTQVKGEKDGYKAIQIGYGRKKHLSKSLAGHLKGLADFRWLREFKAEATAERGQMIDVTTFTAGDVVKVTGWSKGKGFQGVVKRHGFSGSPATHGHKDQLRMPGSIGAGEPQHVFKGKRMAGRMGDEQVTVSNLKVIEVDAANNILYIQGAIPGARNGMVMVYGEGDLIIKDASAVAEKANEPEVSVEVEVPTETEATTEQTVESVEPVVTPEVPTETAVAPEEKVAENSAEEIKA